MAAPIPDPSPPRLRPMTLVLVAAGAIASAAAFALRAPALLFLALPLLVAPLGSLLALPPDPPPLRGTWVAEGSGPEVSISGELRDVGAGIARGLHLDFERAEPLREAKPPTFSWTPGTVRFRLSWQAPYPLLATLPAPQCTLRDPLGLAERELRVQGEPLRIERFPPEAARIGSIPLRRTTALPGEVAARTIGPAGEFFGVRFATPGDGPRRINWRASARAGRACTNEFLLERTGDLLIVLDVRSSGLGPERDRALLSIGRAAARGIASGFLREKDRVGVAVFGEYLSAVALGTGRAHRLRIEHLLDAARVASESAPAERLAVSLRRAYPPGVSTLLITPLADDDSIELLPHLRRRGFPTFVLSPSPLPLLAEGEGAGGTDGDLLRLVRLVRRARIGRAWAEAPVLDWEEYWSLGGLKGLLKLPVRSGSRR